MTLETLLQTEKSTAELSSWGFAFEVTDGRCEYSTPIYGLFLEAFAKGQFTGKVLLFAADVYGVSQHPVYLVQLILVTKENDTEVLGPGFEVFTEFRDLVGELAGADTGMKFLEDFSEIGYATDPLGSSVLRGCIELESGAVTVLKQTNPGEKSLFELSCKERYPALTEAPLSEEEEADDKPESMIRLEPVQEPLFNLFVYVHGEHVVALGANVHEVDEDEATCLAFLQQMVPRDALVAPRYTFPPSEATETLPCGTVGLPVGHYEILKMQGQVLDLFEPIFQRHSASEAPLICVTTVQDGVPFNDAGPIYEGGSAESDKKFRHKVFLSKLLETMLGLLSLTAEEQGRGVFLLLPEPKTLDPENRKLIYLKQEDCTEPGPDWDEIRKFLSEYDPQAQAIFIFKDANGESVYRLNLPSMEERMQQPS